jgi:uncharacterized protein (DUF305 family)
MMVHGSGGHGHMDPAMMRRHYMMLALNLGLGLLIMYLGMFAMIWSWGEFVQNVNFFYMALVMWAPMSAVMLLTMRSMYPNAKLNALLYALFAIVLVLSFLGIREQGLVGDRQFVRSMIPHHSGAILMCERASMEDAEIRHLCGNIIESQKQEIDQMKRILERL